MKRTIITHGDVDGITAAAILLRVLKKSGQDAKIYFSQPFSLNKTLGKLRKPDKIYIIDLAVDYKVFERVRKRLNSLRENGTFVVWIDHHESSKGALRLLSECTDMCIVDISKSASQLIHMVYDYTDSETEMLARLGAASDKIIQDKNAAQISTVFGAAISETPNDDTFREWLTRKISNGVKKLPTEVQDRADRAKEKLNKLINGGKVVFENQLVLIKRYGKEAYGSASGISGNLASMKNKVVIIISEVESSPGLLLISSRQPYDRDNIVCDLDHVMDGLKKLGGSGGGHTCAAGGRFSTKNYDQVIEYFKDIFSIGEKI